MPSSLIASWLATGPPVIVLDAAGERVHGLRVGEVLDGTEGDEHDRGDDRDRQQHADDGADQVGPEVADPAVLAERARPRAKAAATAMPTAAETKFCTVRPDIWKRWPTAASPEYHCQLVLVTNETAVFHAPSPAARRTRATAAGGPAAGPRA